MNFIVLLVGGTINISGLEEKAVFLKHILTLVCQMFYLLLIFNISHNFLVFNLLLLMDCFLEIFLFQLPYYHYSQSTHNSHFLKKWNKFWVLILFSGFSLELLRCWQLNFVLQLKFICFDIFFGFFCYNL